jgi:hypothetical protein
MRPMVKAGLGVGLVDGVMVKLEGVDVIEWLLRYGDRTCFYVNTGV